MTPKTITAATQEVVWQASHTPFGKANLTTEVIDNNLRFPGQYFDQETGLHYNWNRYYDPMTGRYVTSDPIGLDGGLNTYGYVGGNPLFWIDPNGLFCKQIKVPFGWRSVDSFEWKEWGKWRYDGPVISGGANNAGHGTPWLNVQCRCVRDRPGTKTITDQVKYRYETICVGCFGGIDSSGYSAWDDVGVTSYKQKDRDQKLVNGGIVFTEFAVEPTCREACGRLNK